VLTYSHAVSCKVRSVKWATSFRWLGRPLRGTE